MRKRPLTLLFFAVMAVCVAILHFFPERTLDSYETADKKDITFAGRLVRKEVRTGDDGEKEGILYLRIGDRRDMIQVYTGKSIMALPAIGQTVRVRGTIRAFNRATNPGEFDVRLYYRKKNVVCRMYRATILQVGGSVNAYGETLFFLQRRICDTADMLFDARGAGVIKALLVGDKSSLDEDLKELYRRNGILHILAVSGLHISFLGTLLLKLLKRMRIPLALSCPVIVFVMVSYGFLCGMTTSAFRAVMMFSLKVFAPLIGRTYDMLSAMSLAGISLLFEQMLYAADSGFLLSFGAVAGLGILRPALSHIAFFRQHRAFCVSLSVMLSTLPVYPLFLFTFPLYAVFLNMAILPFAGVLLTCGWLSVISGCVFQGIGRLFALPVKAVLQYYELMCEGAGALPFSNVVTGHTSGVQVFLYVALLFAFVFFSNRAAKQEACPKKLLLLPVLAAGILFFQAAPALKITVVDVGQGDGIVLQTKTHAYLIDGGSTSKNAVGKYQLIPFLKHEGIAAIDGVFISHEDEDHISGVRELMEEMQNGGIRIKGLFLPDIAKEARGENYRELALLADRCGIKTGFLHSGCAFHDGALSFLCLGPARDAAFSGANATSVILHVTYGEFSALFTGDVEEEGLLQLNRVLSRAPASVRDLDLLKVAHHGSRYTTDESFLELVDATVSVISCGRENRYGHPHEELLARLLADGTDIYRTDCSGALTVTVTKGGKEFRVSTFLKNVE